MKTSIPLHSPLSSSFSENLSPIRKKLSIRTLSVEFSNCRVSKKGFGAFLEHGFLPELRSKFNTRFEQKKIDRQVLL